MKLYILLCFDVNSNSDSIIGIFDSKDEAILMSGIHKDNWILTTVLAYSMMNENDEFYHILECNLNECISKKD